MGSAFSQSRAVLPKTPTGRLTLVSGTPVQSTDQTAKQNIYYTPYVGSMVPLYDGTSWVEYTFTELTLALAGSANWVSGSMYDLFIVNDGGTLRLLTGPAWTSITARSAAISRQNGLYVNTASMTGRYAASSTMTVAAATGLYVGTVIMSASGACGISFGTMGSGTAQAANFGLQNYYNKVPVSGLVADDTNSWSYGSATWRSANNSTGNRVTVISCDGTDWIEGNITARTDPGGGALPGGALGYDSTSVIADGCSADYSATGATTFLSPTFSQLVGLGQHYIQSLESDLAAIASTFYGDGSSTWMNNGLHYRWRF